MRRYAIRVATVRVDDPAEMNVLGLFLAARLRAYDGEPALRGALTVDAEGMRATVRFEEDGATITRQAAPARSEIAAPFQLLVDAMLRPRLTTLLRVKVKGSRLFALRAMRVLRP
jgi:hypothetical protein